MKTKSKIPALRFKGFTDAWEERKLKDVTERVRSNDGRMDLPTLTMSASSGWLDQKDRFSGDISGKEKKNYTLLKKGELSYNHGNSKLAKYGVVFSLTNYEEALVPRVYHSFKALENTSADFIEYMFSTKLPDRELGKLVSSGARMDGLLNINYDDFMNIHISIPNYEEQILMSAFFRKLDETIALHQRKCDQTKELKKTMLQKMFPKKGERIPEIRFPEFTDEWEEKKLGEMLTERNVQQVPQEDAPLVSFTVENGVTPKTDRYDREFLVRTGDKKYKYTTFDDIVYNPANLKFGAIARNKFGDAVFSPIYVTLVADKEKVLPIFIERIVTNGNFIQESLRYQEGTVYERMSVKVPDFLSMKISIPSLPEQEAIGAYFQTLDQDIAQIEKKLADLKELKKTLLRQLFV